ncbi:MAG: ASKHA domain-containing protein [Candidatus Thorarchaeota archaeon]
MAGNTAVHHLFFDYPTDTLLEAPYRAQRRGAVRVRASDVNLPFTCDVWSPPIVESYVGSDLVSVLVELEHRPVSRPTLVMDVGVNTEIAVLTDERTWVSSAPSGPAFEGMSMECGVPAKTGAITDVRIEIDGKGANIKFETLGDGPPIGISGCGAVSLVAEMVRQGIITRDGSISPHAPAVTEVGGVKRFMIVPPEESACDGGIYLTQVDLRMLQLSKAAVAAAVMTVLRHARLRPDEVRTMVLAGAFGACLSLDDATEIGLLPPLVKPEVLRAPEAVLEGLDRMLADEEARARGEILASSSSYIDLSSDEEFDALLARLRLFTPLSVDEFYAVE